MQSLKPTNDFVFKKIFGERKNEDILKDLIESILTNMEIKKVEVDKDVTLERKQITDKLGILDVVATLNDNTRVNIEMQVKDYYDTIERSLFYGTGIYHDSLTAGKEYIDIPKSVAIWITDYDVFTEGPFHERAFLKRDYENIILTDKLEMHYIQLSKFRKKCKRISTKLEEWLTFIENENMEELSMIKNKYVKKAEKELEYLSGDAETRRLAQLREKAIRDELAAIAKARREGKEEGVKKEKIEIAKKMLAKKIDINTIIEVTGLQEEEIKKLQ